MRDPTTQVPRIYGDTRAEGMWGAGYVTAEDRLFFMDVLRHTAKGTTAELLGPSAAAADSTQVGIQDDSPQQLTAEMQSLPQTMGAEGAQALNDIQQYVAGINAFINLTQVRSGAACPPSTRRSGSCPQPWTLADSAAVGVYLIGQFTVFGGQQPQQAEALAMAEQRLGQAQGGRGLPRPASGRRSRCGGDASPPSSTPTRPGRVNPRSEAMHRSRLAGGARRRDRGAGAGGRPIVGRRHAARRGRSSLAADGLRLPHLESNAVLVDAQRSGTGQALAVMGPQVGYYTPEVFLEYELHAPGIDVSGVSFPGASPYPLIGHGTDFAWTGTSAFSANEDVFAERLCNPDGSTPVVRLDALPLPRALHRVQLAHDRREHAGGADQSRAPRRRSPCTRSTRSTARSAATRPSDGVPVALAIAAATSGHEAQSYVAFMRLAENVPTSPQSFIAAMRAYTGSENWFYVDRREHRRAPVGLVPGARPREQSRPADLGDRPVGLARASSPRPTATRGSRRSANPTSIDPKQGYLVNWNNAIAHGWRVAAGDWENGPVVRATILQDLLSSALRHGRVDLAGLTRRGDRAVVDRGSAREWRCGRGCAGSSGEAATRRFANWSALLNGWAAAGSQRRAAGSSNVVDDSPAVLLMDTWWPLLVRAEFQPAVGQPLMNFINQQFNSIQPDGLRDGTGNGFFEGWEMDVQKDLRQVLHRRVAGRFSRTYCGGGSLKRCRALLVRTLLQAAAQLRARYGASMANWKLPVTCAVTTPPSCDQIVPTSAGAINVPPQPFDNRGTFYQAVALTGHR